LGNGVWLLCELSDRIFITVVFVGCLTEIHDSWAKGWQGDIHAISQWKITQGNG